MKKENKEYRDDKISKKHLNQFLLDWVILMFYTLFLGIAPYLVLTTSKTPLDYFVGLAFSTLLICIGFTYFTLTFFQYNKNKYEQELEEMD